MLTSLPPDSDPPPPGNVTCDACWKPTQSPCGQTNTCENITLPKTSFAGGNNVKKWRPVHTTLYDSWNKTMLNSEDPFTRRVGACVSSVLWVTSPIYFGYASSSLRVDREPYPVFMQIRWSDMQISHDCLTFVKLTQLCMKVMTGAL